MKRKFIMFPRRSLLMVSTGLFLCAYGVTIGFDQSHKHKKEAGIRFSVQQLNARITAAHRALIASKTAVSQRVELQRVSQGEDWFRPIWVVEWEDSQGEVLARTTWDAVTGKLLVAEHPVRRATTATARNGDSYNAVKASWRWMEAVGASRDAQHWQLNGPPRIKDLSWVVIWQAEGFRTTVMMDLKTLDLNYLMVRES